MPRIKVVPTIKPCERGFEVELKAVDSFYKWHKTYREIGDAYTEAVELGLATLEGDQTGRLSFVKRTFKLEVWIETEHLERSRFRLF